MKKNKEILTVKNNKHAVKLLKKHNKWRKGEPPYDCLCPMPVDAKELGLAIDIAIQALKSSYWIPVKEWKKSYGECLFVFWYKPTKEFEIVFTSPLADDFYLRGYEPLYFMKATAPEKPSDWGVK